MSYASEVLADTPAGFWRCQEASGLLQDSSGNARHATSSDGTAQYQQTSPITSDGTDKAIYFDGDANFSIPDVGVDLGDTLSMECWVKRTTTGISESIINKGLNAYELRIESDNKVYLTKMGDLNLAVSTSTITDTNWHHIVATKNGTGAGQMKIYIDTVDVTSELFDDQTLSDTATALFIGSDVFGGDFCNSHLDEIAVYDGVLSESRVQAHYDAATTSLSLDSCLPDADITTTGWSTAPLFSKVNDASDATVITATAS